MHTTVMLNWRRWYQNVQRAERYPANSRGRVSVAVLNHTFTSYISALGAHREQLTILIFWRFLMTQFAMLMTRYTSTC